MPKKLRYKDFARKLDLDKLYEALGWEPIDSNGAEDRGYCLFPERHTNGDTTGKFSINREKLIYGCWVCGGGDLLDLVMNVKDLDFHDATHFLHAFADDSDPDDWLEGIRKKFEFLKKEATKEPLPYFNERVLDKWEPYHEWMKGRGISEGIAERYKLRYDAKHRKVKKDGITVYEGPAIIIPHFWSDKLVGWQERWLDDDRPDWVPKYSNTHDFPREYTVFNWDSCFRSGHGSSPLVVESAITALKLESERIPAMATFGDHVTEGQMVHLRGFIDGLTLCPDNDKPGVQWLRTMYRYLNRYVPLLWVKPPGEFGSKRDFGDVVNAEEYLGWNVHLLLSERIIDEWASEKPKVSRR